MKKLKILQFICPIGFYGAERWVLALANNLSTESIEYCDLVVTKEPGVGDLDIVKYYPQAVGDKHELPMKGRFDLSVINQLAQVLINRKIDVIHTHGYKSDLIGILAARKAKVKCVTTPHGFGENIDFKLKMFVKLGCFSYRFFDRVVPLSRQLYDEVSTMGVPENKMEYIQNGVDLTEVEAYRRSLITDKDKPKSGKHIGFVGQMIARKNIKDLLMVFDTLWQEDKTLKLSLLGDGEQRKELESLAKGLESNENIHFLGFRADRLTIMQSFDLFAMTSNLEGIPRCLMEALAMEIPVAAYDIAGVDQLVEDKKTGLLAPLGDKIALQKIWKILLYQDAYAEELAENGRSYVNERFSGARMAREYVDLFERLVGCNDAKDVTS